MMRLLFILAAICAASYAQGPRLQLPAHESVVHTANPVFTWVNNSQSRTHLIRLVPILEGQTPYMALAANTIIYEATVSANTLVYPVVAPQLISGTSYVWQVCEVSASETIANCSEAFVFTYTEEDTVRTPPPSVKIYPVLKTTRSGNIYKVKKGLLPFSFDGKYQAGELNFEIVNEEGEAQDIALDESLTHYGNNRYVLNIKGLKRGAYTLRVRDAKGRIWMLDFRK